MNKLLLPLALLVPLCCAGGAWGQGVPGSGNGVPSTQTGALQLAPIRTVTTLPACNAAAEGTWSAVSDATAPTYNAALTGSGTVHVPVYCNGTAWTSH